MSTAFDYRALADRLSLSADELAELEAAVRGRYAGDEMLVDLRLLRTLRAIEQGALTVAAAVEEFRQGVVKPESFPGSWSR